MANPGGTKKYTFLLIGCVLLWVLGIILEGVGGYIYTNDSNFECDDFGDCYATTGPIGVLIAGNIIVVAAIILTIITIIMYTRARRRARSAAYATTPLPQYGNANTAYQQPNSFAPQQEQNTYVQQPKFDGQQQAPQYQYPAPEGAPQYQPQWQGHNSNVPGYENYSTGTPAPQGISQHGQIPAQHYA